MSRDLNEILDNPFTISLLEDFSEFTHNANKRDGFSYEKNNHHLLSNKEKQIYRIFKLQNNLTNTIRQIHSIMIFIRRFPLKDFYSKNRINQLDYLQYHTEVFFHKVHTIAELMKLMINELYELKLSPVDCSWKRITSKLNPSLIPLKIIDQYYDVFKNIISVRHLNSHRGIYNDKHRDEIDVEYGFSIYETYELLGKDVGKEFQRMFPPILIRYEIKKLRKERINLIDKSLSHIYIMTKDFFTSLTEQYEIIKNAP